MSDRFEHYPLGLDKVQDPDLAERIRARAWPRRRWTAPPVVVDAEDFLDYEETKRMCGVRTVAGIDFLAARGILQQCFRATDGLEGVTRSSAEVERQWRAEASLLSRAWRRLGGILQWI